ncbi:hypothetical protein KY347_03780 [Candidatus Woesearchaeota archaeon]|nr:hypothetical protein [Candidatus Woesearchaeota archaeon]
MEKRKKVFNKLHLIWIILVVYILIGIAVFPMIKTSSCLALKIIGYPIIFLSGNGDDSLSSEPTNIEGYANYFESQGYTCDLENGFLFCFEGDWFSTSPEGDNSFVIVETPNTYFTDTGTKTYNNCMDAVNGLSNSDSKIIDRLSGTNIYQAIGQDAYQFCSRDNRFHIMFKHTCFFLDRGKSCDQERWDSFKAEFAKYAEEFY